MIFDHRRLLTLGVLAALIVGTAVASRRIPSPPPTRQISAEALLERAQGKRGKDSTGLLAQSTSAEFAPQDPDGAKSNRRHFTIYRNEAGEIACRSATADEIREREGANPEKSGLRRINHFELDKSTGGQSPAATNLVIVLRATQQLQQNAAATAAFNRAAQNWENVIMSPITIYLDVDFGATNFGQTWPSGVLGATRAPGSSYLYQSVRVNLIAEANGEGNAAKQGIFNVLPSTAVPTDLGDGAAVSVSNSIARAIGLLPATAQSTDEAARIAFNSNFTFDFDPSDGIAGNAIDFDAVATHEIGHALGFESEAGLNIPKPSVWDLYRFRTGTTASTFTTAQRIVTIGGSPNALQFFFVPGNSELGLSTGGPTGSVFNGGDGWQSSHWKHVSGCAVPIGIMDPAIPSGCRRTISANDQLALSSFGYNLTNNNAPPPPPPPPPPPANDNFANAQAITGCFGSTTGTSFGATSEPGEPSHDPADSSSLSPSNTVWFQWQAPSSGVAKITTDGSDFDSVVAVYTGNSLSSLTQVAFNDDSQAGVITSSVTFNASAGTTYSIAVDGWGGDQGSIKLSWTGCVVVGATATPIPTPIPTSVPTGIRQVSLPTNDIVYDPVSQRIFASVPSRARSIGNSITEINPFSATIGPSVFVGNEPNKLAIGNTFHYIYAGLDGAAAVRRFDLASRTPDFQFTVGFDPTFGPMYVRDMEVMPFTPGAVAISRRFIGVSPERAGVAVYDDGIQRPTATTAGNGSNVIEFSGSSNTLYGYYSETTEFGFRKMAIDDSGVSVVSVNSSLISGFGVNIRFDNGRIYTANGRVIDPEAQTQVGSFPNITFSYIVLPDPTTNRVYFLSTDSSPAVLIGFDKTTFKQTGTLTIPGVSGSPTSLIKWGADGLAFRTTGNQV
ncbi:MAG TPA: NF038122 family metalloprotease, partial [Pyrinomonadaceae bacterium]|nr:NF038122 family metalloprotease [Pyrinomonadaceae bacterium]